MTEQRSPSGPPEFGPAGYLPERAARRARKIVLREQMSTGWPLASLVAGAVLVGATVLFLLTRTGPPGPPFEAVAESDTIEVRSAQHVPASDGDAGGGGGVLLVHTGSAVRAFAAPDAAVVFCQASGHLEGADGSVWTVAGQRVGGTAGSLEPLPVALHRGTVYVNPEQPRPAPPPADTEVTPTCG